MVEDSILPSAEYLARLEERRVALRVRCASLLPGSKSFVWEIGCGHGHFLTAYAAAHPDELCVGIDLILDRIDRANRKQERAGLNNLHFLRAEAMDFLSVLPDRARFSSIYLLFPDPWPKRRHHKNRLLGAGFLHAAAARAGQGTRLYFRTDDEPYFAEGAAAIAAHDEWRPSPVPAWPFEAPTVFQQRAACYRSLVAERV